MRFLPLGVAIFLCAVCLSARAQGLGAVRSLKCHFAEGVSTQWKSSKPQTSPIIDDANVVFDSIDIKKGTARLIGNVGAEDIAVISRPVGLTFIAVAPLVVDVTTVYASGASGDEFLAVNSRHTDVVGTPAPQQYFGRCKVWQ